MLAAVAAKATRAALLGRLLTHHAPWQHLLKQLAAKELLGLPAVPCLPSLLFARGVKRAAQHIRTGDIVQYDGRLKRVTKFAWEHGRARAQGFILLDLADLTPGSKGGSSIKFGLGEQLEVEELTASDWQVLYVDGGLVHCLHPTTFEQTAIPEEVFGTGSKWLLPETTVKVKWLADKPVSGSVPPKVSVKVVEARPPVMREDGSSNRHVVVEGGANVLVPAHITKGDTISVSTHDGTYTGKV